MSKGARERSLDSFQKALEAPGLGVVFVHVIRSAMLGMPNSHSGLGSLQRHWAGDVDKPSQTHTVSVAASLCPHTAVATEGL